MYKVPSLSVQFFPTKNWNWIGKIYLAFAGGLDGCSSDSFSDFAQQGPAPHSSLDSRNSLGNYNEKEFDLFQTNMVRFIQNKPHILYFNSTKKELKWFSSSSLLLFFLSVNTPWQAKCSWPIKEFLSTPTQSIFVLIIPYLTFSAVRDFLYFENSILPCSISSRSFPITTKCVLFHVPRYSLLDNKKNVKEALSKIYHLSKRYFMLWI